MLIDTHAHLLNSKFNGIIEEKIKNFKKAGVKKTIEPGVSLESSIRSKDLANKYKEVFFAPGIHPSMASRYDTENLDVLRELLKDKKAVAVGEIGLDFHYDNFDKELQKKAFKEQIKLANEAGLPFIIHTRDAYKETYDLLMEHKKYINNKVLFHCYSGSKEFALEILKEFDAYFAFGGVITFKNAKKEHIINAIPKEKIVLETDSPYLTPHPFRGSINEPAKIFFVYKELKYIWGMTGEETEKLVWENAHRLFPKLKL